MSPVSASVTKENIRRALPHSHGVQEKDLSRLSLEDIEGRPIKRVLDASGGSKTQAAKSLQIDYKTLLNKLKRYGCPEDAPPLLP